jgi:peroxiredoxin
VKPRFRPASLVLLAALLGGDAGEAIAQKKPALGPFPGRRVGDLAFDFNLKDLNDQAWSMEALRGRKVVHLVFWATWCVPCMQEIPALNSARERYAARGLEVLAVVVPINQQPGMVRAVARDYKIAYPVLFDSAGDLSDKYKVDSIPRNFLIGRDGIIRYTGTELPPQYDRLVEGLLAETPKSTPSASR